MKDKMGISDKKMEIRNSKWDKKKRKVRKMDVKREEGEGTMEKKGDGRKREWS